MSAGRACAHRPRPEHVVVIDRLCNHSAFNGYRWTPSEWSSVLCLTCGTRWRSRALWVGDCRDATEAEILGTPLLKNMEFAEEASGALHENPLRPQGSPVS